MPTPDPGIKKVIVQKSTLPGYFGTDQQYVVRYRIVSEDKNRTSHWSLQYKLDATPQEQIDYSIVVNELNNTVTVVWNNVKDVKEYDVYSNWDSLGWNYVTTVATTTFASLITGSSTVQIAVQVPTFPKERFTGATLFQTEITNV
jgi:hypothetical protein